MARTSWFDDADLPIIDEQAGKLESFTQAMADGQIDSGELHRQQEAVVRAMHAIEPELTDEQHEKVTRLLVEMSAYNVMRLLHELQKQRMQRRSSRL